MINPANLLNLLLTIHFCSLLIYHSLYFSDGMARTGVFIAAMSEVERVKAEGEIDLFQTVKAARSKRPHMISTLVSCGVCVVCVGGW